MFVLALKILGFVFMNMNKSISVCWDSVSMTVSFHKILSPTNPSYLLVFDSVCLCGVNWPKKIFFLHLHIYFSHIFIIFVLYYFSTGHMSRLFPETLTSPIWRCVKLKLHSHILIPERQCEITSTNLLY